MECLCHTVDDVKERIQIEAQIERMGRVSMRSRSVREAQSKAKKKREEESGGVRPHFGTDNTEKGIASILAKVYCFVL